MQDALQQLAKLAELQKEVTPGPWVHTVKGNSIQSQAIAGVCSGISLKTGNATFIATAGSTDFAALLATLSAPAPLATGGAGEALREALGSESWQAGMVADIEKMNAAAERAADALHDLRLSPAERLDLSRGFDQAAGNRYAVLADAYSKLRTAAVAALSPAPGVAIAAGGEPEGDGGIWALQRLAAYCREAGHYAALDNIRAAAHNLGWCIDDGGADRIDPTTGTCPLCFYCATPQPAPAASEKGASHE